VLHRIAWFSVAVLGLIASAAGQGLADETLSVIAKSEVLQVDAYDAAIEAVPVDARKIEAARDRQFVSMKVRHAPASTSLFEQNAQAQGQGGGSGGEDQEAKLAMQLSNPVAALISVPFQSNFDFGGGPDGDGFRYTLNFQPVIPISISENWNLISRTIVPFISQDDMIGTSSQTGLGDITQSLFFSPKNPTKCGGIIWGAGPVFLLPSATDDLLGSGKWGIGPTAVVLKQTEGWTFGALVNHIWSVAGQEDREDVSSTFLQPFITYTTKTHTTFGVNTESTYDWEDSQWTVPLNAWVSQILKIGKMPISLQLGGRYFAEGPAGTPDWGIRFTVTLLFPK
jgi:hypothetical protein